MGRRNRNVAGHLSSELHPKEPRRPLLAYLKGLLPSLSPAERLIADCVLSDPEKIIGSSIADVKQRSGASVGSIVTFCRSLGLKGFADFRIALARDLAQSGMSAGDSAQNGSTFERAFYVHAQCLAETLRINPSATIDRVVQALGRARKIEFFSIGLSFPVAYTACAKFVLLGMPAAAQCDSHMQLIAATQLKTGDVAFGVSCSGSTRETVQCLQEAKKNGATTIALTNTMKSPITHHSHLCLFATPSEIMYFQAPLASRITQLAVIDALFVSLALKNKNKTSNQLQHSAEVLLERRLDYT